MNKIILLVLVCLSTEIWAQKSFFGLDAGISVANQRIISPYALRGGTAGVYENIVKPTFGLLYQFNLLDQLGIRANPRYQVLGYHYSYTNTFSFNANGDVNISYLAIPVSLVYYANKNLSLNGGSFVSFKTSDNVSGYHKNDFGFIIGIEHSVYKNFSLALNYVIGTKNIWLSDQGGLVKYYNRAFQFSVIYKFKKTS